MKVTIHPSGLAGTIEAIASKSQAHRLLICAALADRPTRIRCSALSRDIEATAGCLRGLGAAVDYTEGTFLVRPLSERPAGAAVDADESGSTLRFLLPVVCALGIPTEFHLGGRLPERPLSPLWEELERHGALLSRPAPDRLRAEGSFRGGEFTLAANVSSQFISGLLFALPCLPEGGSIRLTGTLESASYLEMTLRALERFGVHVTCGENGYTVPGGPGFRSPGEAAVEGDWSNAAFWICADRILGGTLSITGLDPGSPQGDRAVERESLRVAAGSAVVDCRDIPDLLPVLAVLASVSPGQTRFVNAGRLRLKESDRLAAVSALLTALGGQVRELEDGLIVTGVPKLRGGEVSSFGDHRIAMSAAVAALACREPVILHGAEAVNKSYPAFWEDYRRLGGQFDREEEL